MAPFETPRLRVRPWIDPDAPALLAIYGERAVTRWIDRPPLTSVEAALAAFAKWRALAAEAPPLGWYALEERATGAIVGNGGLLRWAATSDVEIGYHLGRAHWGRGFATEFARAAIAHVLGPLGRDRAVAVTLPTNLASRRVMERAGMRHVGQTDFKGYWSVLYEATGTDQR